MNQDAKTENIYDQLNKQGIDTLYDDRDISAGEKFADSDLIGIPYRLVVSSKTGDKIEVKKRGSDKNELMSVAEVIKLVTNNE